MPGIIYDLELTIGPVLAKYNRLIDRTDHIVATMNYKTRYVLQYVRIIEYLTGFKETAVSKVVALYTRDTKRNMRITEVIDHFLVRLQSRCRTFPDLPGFSGSHPNNFVFAGESLVIGSYHVITLGFRDRFQVLLPGFGEKPRCAILI